MFVLVFKLKELVGFLHEVTDQSLASTFDCLRCDGSHAVNGVSNILLVSSFNLCAELESAVPEGLADPHGALDLLKVE